MELYKQSRRIASYKFEENIASAIKLYADYPLNDVERFERYIEVLNTLTTITEGLRKAI
jgi:hypothetical protein